MKIDTDVAAMARHFGINLVKLDNEKRKMLDECRRLNARKSANG